MVRLYVLTILSILWTAQSWAVTSIVLDDTSPTPIQIDIPTAITDKYTTEDPTFWLKEDYSDKHYSDSLKPNPSVYWYKLNLQTTWPQDESRNRILILESHILRHASFHLFEGETLIKSKSLGLNDHNTEIDDHMGLNFKGSFIELPLNGEAQYTLLIRKQNDGPGLLPLTLLTPEDFENDIYVRNLFWGGVMAILIVMALYNLIVYSLHPSKAYLWYLAFHSTCFVYFSALNAYGYLIWPYWLQSWLAQNIMSLNFLVVFLILQFARHFLEIKTYAQWHHKYVNPLSFIALAGVFISLFVKEYTMIPIFSVIQLVGTVFGISMGWVAYKNGLKAAKFFLLSWVFTLTGGAIGMGTAVGEIPANFFTLHGFLFGTLCELFLFSVALAYRIKDIEDHFLSRSYFYPDTNIANFSYLKNKLPDYLPDIQKKHGHIAIFIFDLQGYRELVSLYGPDALTKNYRYQTDQISKFIQQQPWSIPMPFPSGEKVFIAALPGEQVFMMMDTGSNRDIEKVQEVMLDLLKQSEVIQDGLQGKIKIRFIAGISFLEEDDSIQKGFREAQVALLSCLQQQKNYLVYDANQDLAIANRTELVIDLDKAIKNGSLDLYIQPQYSLATNEIEGGEILLRWTHPEKGPIGPAIFIPLAEQSGLIFSITKLVIDEACKWLKQLKEQHPSFYNKFQLSINISALDIAEPQFLPYLQSTLFYYGIENQRIMLEVTESAVLNNADLFIETIQKLRTLGFPISIDDFGTGYSSMQYLQTMKAEEIKIDMTFVRDIHRNRINQDITRAIIQLAKATHSQTVAEGIESAEEAQALKQLSCEYGQGFYWQKPLPLSEFNAQFLS